MRVYLDDERSAPEGWILVRWPEEAIELLQSGEVEMISLDHDLGEHEGSHTNPRTGYDVLKWMERAVVEKGFIPPTIFIHTQNSPARLRMKQAVAQICKLYSQER